MTRKPVLPGRPRNRWVNVRFDAQGLARLDELRGPATRSDYLRGLVANASRQARPPAPEQRRKAWGR